MHGLLIGLLVFGLQWTQREPEPVQAELWVAPAANAPRPEPRPEPEPTPEPPAPPSVAEPEPPRPPPKAEPDIPVEQVRKQAEREAAERRQAEREAEQRAREARALAERKLAERKAAEHKAAEDKRAKDEQAKREADRKAADDRRRAEQARRDAELAGQRRAEDIRRLQNQAGMPGSAADPAARGAASGQTDASYGARVGATIRSNTIYQIPAELDGNPRAVFLVQLRSDCALVSVRLRRSSGVPSWDQAAERGIQRTDPFPRPTEGACPGELEITRGPRDER